ncbi:hypothetical protein F53441_11677 [Fusarium austroafricanum]|uniref:Uncharacterized protein n=1 Tax=Fusarium austroafricanum TaxID=2364996 RepID=A0A8H4NSI0_9HYPO|nr:hypothetical protein F53441_11677 [Fusarium austroafricanum]
MWRRAGTESRERPPFPPRCDWLPQEDLEPEALTVDWLLDELKCRVNYVHANDQNLHYYNDRGLPEDEVEPDNLSLERSESKLVFHTEDEELLLMAREARVLHVAFEALGDPRIQSQINEFRVDASHDVLRNRTHPGLPWTVFFSSSPFPESLAKYFSAANTTKFQLVLNKDTLEETAQDVIAEGRAARVLRAMPHLRELVLEPHHFFIFEIIPEDMHFPYLRHLELSCGEIDPVQLTEFLKRHGSTLKSLLISFCYIDPEYHEYDWRDVANDLNIMKCNGKMDCEEGDFQTVYLSQFPYGCGKNDTLNIKMAETRAMSWEYYGGRLETTEMWGSPPREVYPDDYWEDVAREVPNPYIDDWSMGGR